MALTKNKKFSPYSQKVLIPASRNQIYAEMEDITKIEHLCEMTEFAFVRRDPTIGDIYNIYINNVYPPGIDMLRVHEYGHIRFSHFRSMNQKESAIENTVKREWEKIKHHFSDDVSPQQAAKWLALELNNILMDFEVNSKLFTVEEYDTMQYITDDIMLKQREKWAEDKDPKNAERAKNAKAEFDELCKIKQENSTNHLTKLCWPANYDFPLGLDYEAYVVLAIKNLDKFINDMKNNMAAQVAAMMQGGGSGNQNQQQSNGQGQNQSQNQQNGQGAAGQGQNQSQSNAGSGQNPQAQNGPGQGQGNQRAQGGGQGQNNGKITSAVIKKSAVNAYEVADKGSPNDLDTGGSDSGNAKDKGNSSENIVREGDADMSNEGGHGYSREGRSATPSPVSTGSKIEDMMKFIIKHAFAKAKTHVIRDQMYNYNRRKHSGTVIIPKNKTIEHYQLSNVVIVVDTSGSVSVKSVEDTLTCIKEMRGKFNPNKSHVISWDTHLVKDTLWKEAEVDYSQGGTNIAKGIKYAKKYCKKDNDKLFVVSDFEDDLKDWEKALRDIPGEKYGICTIHKQTNSEDPEKIDKANQTIVEYVKSNSYDRVGFNEIFAYQY